MQRNLIPVLVLLILGTVGIFTWRALDGGSPSEVPGSETGGPAVPSGAQPDPADPDELSGPMDSVDPEPGGTASAEARSDRSTVEDASFEGGPRVRGRIETAGVPLPEDEVLEIWSLVDAVDPSDLAALEPGAELPTAALRRAPLNPDGTFEAAFPRDMEKGWILVTGRYTFMETVYRVRLQGDNASQDLTVDVEVGAWIEGRVLPPHGRNLPPTGDLEVRLGPDRSESMGIDIASTPGRIETEVDPEGRFELRGVPAFQTWRLSPRGDGFAQSHGIEVETAVGAHLTLELGLSDGARLRGTVVDEEGEAIADAEVLAEVGSILFGQGGQRAREGETDASGAFDLQHVATGQVQLRASAAGYIHSSSTLELVEGEDREGIELVLSRGASLAGVVRWPDGTPAVGARIAASFDLSQLSGPAAFNAMRGASGSTTSDAEGKFHLSGLGAGPFTVRSWVGSPPVSAPGSEIPFLEAEIADAAAELGEAVEDPEPGTPPEGTPAAEDRFGRARIDHVGPGTLDLVLELHPPSVLSGRVVDDNGDPIPNCRVQASLSPGGNLADFLSAQTLQDDVDNPEGAFEISDMEAGTWRVVASAGGFARPEAQVLEVGHAEQIEGIEIVLLPAARVSGRVLDPNGNPVADALVGQRIDIANLRELTMDGGSRRESRSRDDGSFDLRGLPIGTVSLVANAAEFAESEAFTADLTSAEHLEDVVLTLRQGARITGEVFNSEGELAEGTTVMTQTPMGSDQKRTVTDENGAFEFDHVTPGKRQVIAMMNTGGELAGDASQDMASLLDSMKFQALDLRDGEDTHVVLGAPPANPVVVSGVVTLGGKPVPGLIVQFLSTAGAEGSDLMNFGTTDEEGHYSIALNEPGTFYLSIAKMGSMGASQSNEQLHTIPEKDEFELDLELPAGRIAGTVRNDEGTPLGGVRVNVTREGGMQSGTLFGGNYTELTTESDGTYEVSWLDPGRYRVSVGGSPFGGLFGSGEDALARSHRNGVDVEAGETVTGIDFKLGSSLQIRGTVVDAQGQPVEGAGIFVRDSMGVLAERVSLVPSDASGAFEYGGLSAGVYTVSARTDNAATSSEVEVRVHGGEMGDVRLVVDPGCTLLLTMLDREGQPIRGQLEVFDSEGRAVHGMQTLNDLMNMQTQGFDLTYDRVGPLPPGSYTVIATGDDGRSVRKPVTLRENQSERKLKLRLR